MHPSRHIIVPFFTVLHWSVTATHAALTSRVPAVAAAHSRDFHAVKRQIHNADYAGGTLHNSMTTTDSAAHSHPTTTTTDAPPASHPSDSIKGSPKDPRSLGSQPQHNTSLSGLPSSPPSLDELVSAIPEERDADTQKGSPRTSDYSGSRSRRRALADASRKMPAYTHSGRATSHVRHSVEKRQGPTHEVAAKSQVGRRDLDIVARALEKPPAKQFMTDNLQLGALHGALQRSRTERAV